jgi:hypothetical protein
VNGRISWQKRFALLKVGKSNAFFLMLQLEIRCAFNNNILSDIWNENEVGVYKDVAPVGFVLLPC